MATTLYIRNTTPSLSVSGYFVRDLSLTAGGSASSLQKATVGSGDHVELLTSVTPTIWVFQVNAVTISGTITPYLWMNETSMSANVQSAVRIVRLNSSGTILSDVVANANANHAQGSELGTSIAEETWSITPTNTSFNDGDYIGIIPHGDAIGTMGSGYNFVLGYDDSASWNSRIVFTETITTYTNSVKCFGQAQAKVRSISQQWAQAQAQIKKSNQVFAQAKTTIVVTARVFAQARSSIKTQSLAFGQAQSRLQGQNWAYSQAQATLITRQQGFAQVSAYIAGTFTYALDTFTRSVSNGWGTANNGGNWTTPGTASLFNVDGSAATYATELSTSKWITLDKTDIRGSNEAYVKFKLDALPTTSNIFIALYAIIPSIPLSVQGHLASVIVNSDGSVDIAAQQDGAGGFTYDIGTYVPNDYWWIKLQTIHTATQVFMYAKAWKDGTSEPSWQNTNASTKRHVGGHPGLNVLRQSSNAITVTVDNFNVYQIWPQGYGQAAAYISGTYTFAQDTFTRTVTDGLGTADNGGDWSLPFVKTFWDVTGSEATVTVSDNRSLPAALPKVDITNTVESKIKFKINQAPTDYVALKLTSHRSSYDSYADIYFAGITFNSDLTYDLGGTYATYPNQGSYSLNTYYWLKTRVHETTSGFIVYIKLWPDASSEPSSWTLSYSSSFSSSSTRRYGGHVGFYIITFTTTPIILTLDNYDAYKAWPTSHGQAQAKINTVSRGYGQARSVIELVQLSAAQARAQIKTINWSFAQVRSAIKRTDNEGFGQAQTWIKDTSLVYAQAQAGLKATSTNVAAAMAWIEQISQVFAQAQVNIKKGNNGLAQALGQIKVTSQIFGQSQAYIQRTDVYSVSAQSRVSIKAASGVFAQVRASIKAITWVFAQSKTDIKATSTQYAQSRAQIGTFNRGYAQVKASIKAQSFGYAQVQASIEAISYGFGQAQAQIQTFVQNNVFGQAQSKIFGIEPTSNSGQSQARIRYHQDLVYPGTNEVPSGNPVNKLSDYFHVTTGQTVYVWVGNPPSDGGNIGIITDNQSINLYHSSPAANSLHTFTVSSSGYCYVYSWNGNTYRPALTGSGSVHTMEDFLGIPRRFGQVLATIAGITKRYGQAQASIGGKTLVIVSAQAQANILATRRAYAQSRTSLKKVIGVVAQAQASIDRLHTVVAAQAQAQIVYPPRIKTAQVGASIKATSSISAQAQAKIISTVCAYGQARVVVWKGGRGYAQAHASVKTHYTKSAQAAGYIAGSYTSVVDTFTRTVTDGWGNADTGGTWSLGQYGGIDLDVTGTEGTRYSNSGNFLTLPKVALNGNVESYIKFKLSRRPSGSGYIGIALVSHLRSSTDYGDTTYYLPRFGNNLNINIQANGTYQLMGSFYSTPAMDVIDANEYWWFKTRAEYASGGALWYAKAWQDGSAEPSWQVMAHQRVSNEMGGHVGIWIYFDATTTITIDNYNVYQVNSVRHAQAQSFIKDRPRAFSQAQGLIYKPSKVAQTQADIKAQGRGFAQACARISKSGVYLAYYQNAQAFATIKKDNLVYAQATVWIYGVWVRTAQAQARITNSVGRGYAQANARITGTTARVYAQTTAKIKRLNTRQYTQAMALILGPTFQYAQSSAKIIWKQSKVAQAQASISPAHFAYAQAAGALKRYIKHSQAQAHLKSEYNFAYAQVAAEIGSKRTFWIRYRGYYLPGYAQQETNMSVIKVNTYEIPYRDGSLSEYVGLENKMQSFRFKVTGATYSAIKTDIQRAGSILHSGRTRWNKIYINRYDRYYLGYPTSVRLDSSIDNSHWAEYTVDFNMKPWALSEQVYTLTGTTSIDTGPRDFITNGGWTPATATMTGTNITISGYTDNEPCTGYISISGAVTNLVVNSENYESSNNRAMRNEDYQIYIGPDRTYFAITGATTVAITWQDRWYE